MTRLYAPDLPEDLLYCLADSDLRVLSWDGVAHAMTLHLTKEIGPESGVITFTGVSHVNLPPRLGIEGMRRGGLPDLPPDFLTICRPGDLALDPGEHVFLIDGSYGESFFVLAERIDYRIDR